MIAASSRVGFVAGVSDGTVTEASPSIASVETGRPGFYSGACRSAKPVRGISSSGWDSTSPAQTGWYAEGLNLASYHPNIETVCGVDLSAELLAKASERVANVGFPVRLLEASCENLPLED